MSKNISIKELLSGVKIEWKKLGEVTDYEQPTKYLNEPSEKTFPQIPSGATQTALPL